ncbi:hypothetical protein GCM10009745_38990 [Kribbella yunnanensis]|uniref:Uncharacterized protein n=1 Tax=Kribbella yunnanensis TaxID=190194 RepID=A0ABN2HLE1_9ACTN
MPKGKSSPALLTAEDEVAFQAAIMAAHPNIRIVESGPWPADGSPPMLDSITDAKLMAFFWPTDLHPVLQTQLRTDGTTWGTHAGDSIQWFRPRLKDGVLDAGTLSVVSSPEMDDLIKSIWRILFRLTTNNLVMYHQPTAHYKRQPTYRIGPNALTKARAGRLTLTDIRLVLYPPDGHQPPP